MSEKKLLSPKLYVVFQALFGEVGKWAGLQKAKKK